MLLVQVSPFTEKTRFSNLYISRGNNISCAYAWNVHKPECGCCMNSFKFFFLLYYYFKIHLLGLGDRWVVICCHNQGLTVLNANTSLSYQRWGDVEGWFPLVGLCNRRERGRKEYFHRKIADGAGFIWHNYWGKGPIMYRLKKLGENDEKLFHVEACLRG